MTQISRHFRALAGDQIPGLIIDNLPTWLSKIRVVLSLGLFVLWDWWFLRYGLSGSHIVVEEEYEA